jgi:hypothetical protein
MDRSVQIMRCRRTGAFLLHPVGTFRGYGAYVGINPYREVLATSSPEELGRTVMVLLELSGPTGIAFADAKHFLETSRDEETIRIRTAYGLNRPKLSTSKLAKRFLHVDVMHKHGQKSWVVQVMQYDSRRRSLVGEDDLVRVRLGDGLVTLGEVLREMMRVTE